MSWYDPRSWFAPKSTEPPGPNRGLLAKVRDQGGWPGPEAAHNTPAEIDLTAEKVRGGPKGVTLPAFLPWFDAVDGETAQIRAAYRPMFADSHVKTAFLGKILAVASLDLKVLPADKKSKRDRDVAEFVKWSLTERLADGIPGLVWSVLSGGLIDGFSVCEKVIKHETRGKYSGKYVLSELKPKDVGRDLVLQTDDRRNVVGLLGLRYNGGEEFHPADFLIYRHLSLYGSPVGTSDFRAAYRPYWIKDTAWKLRALAMERRASPLLFGTYKVASTKASLDAVLSTANSRGWISAPEDAKLSAIDIAGGADGTFDAAIKALAHEIFLAIQGAILQSLEGSTTDGRGNSQVHRQTADQLVWHLAAALQSLLNNHDGGLVRDIVDLNYVVQEYPRALLTAVDVGELAEEWKIDQGLLQAGLKLSKEELYERYGRQRPEEEDDTLEGAKPQQPPPGGGMPFADDQVSLLTAPAKPLDKTTDHTDDAGREVPARKSFRIAREWGEYVR